MTRYIITLCFSLFIITDTISAIDNINEPGPVIDLQAHKKYCFGIGLSIKSKTDILALYNGRMCRYSDDPENRTNLGRFVELEHEFRYTEGDQQKVFHFYSVYAMLSEIKVINGLVRKSDVIGCAEPSGATGPLRKIAPKDSFIFGYYSKERNQYFEKACNDQPMYLHGVYWYDPKSLTAIIGK